MWEMECMALYCAMWQAAVFWCSRRGRDGRDFRFDGRIRSRLWSANAHKHNLSVQGPSSNPMHFLQRHCATNLIRPEQIFRHYHYWNWKWKTVHSIPILSHCSHCSHRIPTYLEVHSFCLLLIVWSSLNFKDTHAHTHVHWNSRQPSTSG